MTEFSEFSLYIATPEQLLEHRIRCSEQPDWAGGLNLKEYLERDRLLDYDEHASDGKLITWVLAPRTNPTTTDFMCSCETYRRSGFVYKSAADGSSRGTASSVVCYAIAGIYTPTAKRGHGHGGHMLRLLHWTLAPASSLPESAFPAAWGAPPASPLRDAAFSVIYSDVRRGCAFYERRCGPGADGSAGWVLRGPESTRWRVDARETNGVGVEGREWRWLAREDVERVWARDVPIMKADARALAKGDDVVLAFLPDEGVGLFTIRWQMAFTAKMEPVYPLATWGVELVGGGEEAPTYATWILGRESPPSLFLTRLRATPETFPKLLRKIMEAARIQSVAAVDTWNIPDEFKEAALELGGETYERETQLPVVKWYGPESSENVVWAFNERFSWI